jgi:hypothetical protein
MTNILQCTYEDARLNHLRDGIHMSTEAKIAWLEEMISLAVSVGAYDRLREPKMTHKVAEMTSSSVGRVE